MVKRRSAVNGSGGNEAGDEPVQETEGGEMRAPMKSGMFWTRARIEREIVDGTMLPEIGREFLAWLDAQKKLPCVDDRASLEGLFRRFVAEDLRHRGTYALLPPAIRDALERQ
jgi:hypothetical protein